MKFLSPLGGEIFEGKPVCLGVADGFIVHIGDVADVEGAGAACFKGAAEDVLEDESAEIPDMGRAVDGGATAVEAVGSPIDRLDEFLSAGEGILKLHCGEKFYLVFSP